MTNIGNVSPASGPADLSGKDNGERGAPSKLRGLDSNPQGAFGPEVWRAFRDTLTHHYDAVSLPDPSEEARFTLATRTYPTPRAILMRCQGTAFTMTRGPAMVARGGADQLMIVLQLEGSVDTDCAGQRGRREPGDVAISDYARPFHAAATDYVNLMLVLPRESVPASLLALEPHGLIFPRGSGAARLIGAALQEYYAQADDLTVSEAEAAVEGIVALTTACARARLAGDEAKSREIEEKGRAGLHRRASGERAAWARRDRRCSQRLARVALPAPGGRRRHSRRAAQAPDRSGSAAHVGGQQGRALADGHRQVLRVWRHDPVHPGIPRALRRTAAAVSRARSPAGPRLA